MIFISTMMEHDWNMKNLAIPGNDNPDVYKLHKYEVRAWEKWM